MKLQYKWLFLDIIVSNRKKLIELRLDQKIALNL